MIGISFAANAQTSYPLTNNLNCDVTIGYEMFKHPSCQVCSFGTVTIPANSSTSLTLCAGYGEICIWIIDIGGTTPALNHSNVVGTCHSITPFGQTGSGIGVACSSTGNWTAVQLPGLPGNWSIQ